MHSSRGVLASGALSQIIGDHGKKAVDGMAV